MRNIQRKTHILNAAIDIAKNLGYKEITLAKVATESNTSRTLIYYYFDTLDALKDAVVTAAFKQQCLPIVAQALIAGHPKAKEIRGELRENLMDFIFKR